MKKIFQELPSNKCLVVACLPNYQEQLLLATFCQFAQAWKRYILLHWQHWYSNLKITCHIIYFILYYFKETSVRSLGILKWQLQLISYKLCLWLHLDIHLYILNFCLKHHGLISFSSEHESNCFRHVHTKLTSSRCSFHLCMFTS